MLALFLACFICLIYVYIGYPFIILCLSRFFVKRLYGYAEKTSSFGLDSLLGVSVIIAAHNEEKSIRTRILNILDNGYPHNKLEIIVGSDGSTDKTVEQSMFPNHNIRVLDFKQNRGRAAVHNDCVANAEGEIVVFSDSETIFEKGFIEAITHHFLNKTVGCVIGNLIYKSTVGPISQSEGTYFTLEKKLRQAESHLGLLITGSGACMAVRKELWCNLLPEDDCDFTTPLDVLLQGFCVVYEPKAVAYDFPPSSGEAEIKVRIRQTAKNLSGTLRRWGIKGFIKHPLLSWALLSHKILRWCTPFFMLIVFFANLAIVERSMVFQIFFIMQLAFYAFALIGWFGDAISYSIPVAQTIYSFCLANLGMLIGVFKALLGRVPHAYKTIR